MLWNIGDTVFVVQMLVELSYHAEAFFIGERRPSPLAIIRLLPRQQKLSFFACRSSPYSPYSFLIGDQGGTSSPQLTIWDSGGLVVNMYTSGCCFSESPEPI